MPEPVTVDAVVAGALVAGANALAGKFAGKAGEDLYARLSALVGRWSAGDVAALEAQAREAKPTTAREAVVAEVIDARPAQEQAEAKALAAALVEALKQQATAGGPIGVEVGRLEALEVDLERVRVTDGRGFSADEVKTDRFRVGGIEVGGGSGKA